MKDVRTEAEAARIEQAEQKDLAAKKMQEAQTLQAQISTSQETLRAEAEKITTEAMELQMQEELVAEAAEAAAAAAAAYRPSSSSGSSGSTTAGSSITASGEFINPCPSGYVSSEFGLRWGTLHKGIDLAASEGTPYYAAASGTVISATYDSGYNGGAGNWIVISHGNGKVTKYMHSSAVYVSVGQQVSQGQNIGAVGNTGNSYGAHLHFQVEVNGVAVDPRHFVSF
jgi:murein DD-endopeptidase MepM/ murein hydrolase activator NlpD